MEKGYRDYGHDIDNTDSVLEAGLGFAVDLKKPGGFIGKEAVLRRRRRVRCTRRIVQILVKDPEPLMFHAEVVRRERQARRLRPRGVVRTHARRRGRSRDDRGRRAGRRGVPQTGTWEVEIAGKLYPAIVSARPLYDPKAERIKM